MKSNYRLIGEFIEQVNVRNTDGKISKLLGVNLDKEFMPSVANINGTDMTKYKVIKKGQFGCKLMSVGRDKKVPISLLINEKEALISSAYFVFEIVDENLLLPEYLMMWFRRSESDRYQWFQSGGDIRGRITWEEFCELPINIPSLEKQQEIVADYNTVQDRIRINEQLNTALEETAQALYKHWFVDFEFPISLCHTEPVEVQLEDDVAIENLDHSKGYKSSGGAMVYNEELDMEIPLGWEVRKLESLCSKIASGSTPKGGKGAYLDKGISLIRSMNVYDFKFKNDDLAFISEEQASKLKNVEIKEDDILFNITGASVARCCIVPKEILPARINQHVMIIRPEQNNFNNYLLMFLCSKDIKRKLVGVSEAGSTRQAITKGDIENINVLVPNEKVLAEFNSATSIILNQRRQLTSNNSELKILKSVLLSKMATVLDGKELVN